MAGTLDLKGEMKNGNVYLEDANAYYPTLQNAIRYGVASKGSGTIKLLANTTETSQIDVNLNKNITVDLNGYTVDGTKIISVANNGNLTINDTSKDKTGKISMEVTNKGILTVKGGNFVKAPVTEEGATTTLNGGTYPIEDIENVVIPEDKEIVENADGTYSIVDVKNEEETPEVTVDTDKNGQNVKGENAVNPKTSDMIMTVVLIAIIALAGMAIAVIKLRKKNA